MDLEKMQESIISLSLPDTSTIQKYSLFENEEDYSIEFVTYEGDDNRTTLLID